MAASARVIEVGYLYGGTTALVMGVHALTSADQRLPGQLRRLRSGRFRNLQ
jgi:hypothetical protein